MERTLKFRHIKSKIDTGRSPRPCTPRAPPPRFEHHQKIAETSEVASEEGGCLRQIVNDSEVARSNAEAKLEERNDLASAKQAADLVRIQYSKKLRSSIHSFSNQLDSVQADHAQQIDTLRSNLESTIESLKSSLRDKDVIVAEKTAEIQELSVELESSRLSRETLLKKLGDVSRSHNEDIQDLSASLQQLVQRNKDLQSQYSTSQQKLKQSAFILDSNTFEIKKLEVLVKKYKNDIESLSASHSQLLQEIEQLKTAAQARDECQKAVDVSISCDIDPLPAPRATHQAECQTEPTISETDHEACHTREKELEHDNAVTKSVNKDLEDRCHLLVNENELVRRKVQQYSEDIDRLVMDKSAELEVILQEHNATLRELKLSHGRHLIQMEQHLQKKDDIILKQTKELEHLQMISESVVVKNRVIEEKDAELQVYQRRLDDLTRRGEQQKITNVRLKEAALLFEEMVTSLEVALKEKCFELEAAENLIEKLRLEIQTLGQQLSKLRMNGNLQTSYRIELQEKRVNLEAAQSLNSKLRLEIQSLAQELSHLRTNNVQMSSRNEDLNSQIRSLQAKMENLTCRVTSYKEELDRVQASNRELVRKASASGKTESSLRQQSEACQAFNKKLRVEASTRLTEKCLAEANRDRLQKNLELVQQECNAVKAALNKEQDDHLKSKRLATSKERQLTEKLLQTTELCDQFRREIETLSKSKKTLKERWFGGEKSHKSHQNCLTPPSKPLNISEESISLYESNTETLIKTQPNHEKENYNPIMDDNMY